MTDYATVSGPKLAPCPFCGASVKIIRSNDIPAYYGIKHYCEDSKIQIRVTWYPTLSKTAEAWNRRAINGK